MGKSLYKVDYHLIVYLYLKFDELPDVKEISKLWESLARLGNRSVAVTFAFNDPAEQTHDKASLGSVSVSQRLLEPQKPVTHFTASVARHDYARDRVRDSDLGFSLVREGTFYGQDTLGYLSLDLSNKVIEETGVETVLDILKQFLEVADRHSAPYGLVDLAMPDDAWAGMVYQTAWPGAAPLHRWLEQQRWVESGSKGDRVRGIYWGNYLGAKILARLGGRESFLQRFREKARNYDGTANALVWDFANGAFVSLCLDPLGCRPGYLHTAAQTNAFWLNREFGINGLLYHW